MFPLFSFSNWVFYGFVGKEMANLSFILALTNLDLARKPDYYINMLNAEIWQKNNNRNTMYYLPIFILFQAKFCFLLIVWIIYDSFKDNFEYV